MRHWFESYVELGVRGNSVPTDANVGGGICSLRTKPRH